MRLAVMIGFFAAIYATKAGAQTQAPSVAFLAPANGTLYVSPATIAVSATASDTDGTVTVVQFYAGTTLIGSDTTSPYSFTWTSVPPGTYWLTAVARDNSGVSTTSASRFVVSTNEAPTVALTSPVDGTTYTAPASIAVSASASDTDGTVTSVDFYAGTTLIGTDTTSPYAVTWNNVPAGAYALTAVARDEDAATATATARTVTVSAGPGTNQAPSVSLLAPANGTLYVSPATIAVSATASDTDGTVTVVQFYAGTTLIGSDTTSPYTFTWTSVPPGTYWLTAVARDNSGVSTTSASRFVVSTNEAPTVALTSPVNGTTYTAPASIAVSASASDTDGTVTAVDFYAGTTLIGTDTTSPYAVTWNNVPAGSYALTAVARDEDAATATATARTVTVSAGPGTNQAPSVSLLAPANGTLYVSPATIAVSATASDTDGTVTVVQFYAGTTLIGSDTTSPYSFTWTSVPPGTYWLTAVARDNSGVSTTSASRFVVSTNEAPTVALTGPVNGTTYTAPASIAVSASASDTDGTVTAVDFYAGTTLIGTDTTSPYAVTWNNVPAGSYALTAVARDEDAATATATARTVTVSAGPGTNQAPSVSLLAPANGTLYVSPATIAVSATASDTDGTVTVVQFYAGTTLIGSDTTSPYSFTWTSVPPGTYWLTAVARDNSGVSTTSASRFVVSTNEAPTVALTGPVNGTTYTAPASIAVSASASDTDGTVTAVDFYAGTTLIGTDTISPYAVTWNNVPAGSYALTAVARDEDAATATATARTVTVALPNGWTASDIGAPLPAGSTEYSNGTYTARSGGNVGGTVDQFHFVYRQISGDMDIRTRVVSIESIAPWSKAGVMVRESLAANSVMGMMFISSSSGSAFDQRLTTGASATTTIGTTVAAPYWVRLQRSGTQLTASQSSDGVTWSTIGTMTFSPATMYVGLAVASAEPAQLAASVFDSVTVATPVTNQPPTISLTSPANGATSTAPASIALAATGSDSDGSIVGVDFYAGTTLLATDTSSPYTFTWSAVPAGSYALSARARDNSGAATTSAVRTVTVSAASTNLAPTVSLTTPAAGAVFTAPATVVIAATASDPDGSVVQVDFYAGAVLIGSDTTSPYSMSWSSVAAGPYPLTAVARDNLGAMTVSGARDIRVDSVSLPRTVIFTASADHAIAVDRYFLEIFPAGANPAVANPVATRDLGKPAVVNGEIQVDISSTTTALPSGSYIATVTAIGDGGSARSAASPAFTR